MAVKRYEPIWYSIDSRQWAAGGRLSARLPGSEINPAINNYKAVWEPVWQMVAGNAAAWPAKWGSYQALRLMNNYVGIIYFQMSIWYGPKIIKVSHQITKYIYK
jgi:hypothetical protein